MGDALYLGNAGHCNALHRSLNQILYPVRSSYSFVQTLKGIWKEVGAGNLTRVIARSSSNAEDLAGLSGVSGEQKLKAIWMVEGCGSVETCSLRRAQSLSWL